MHNFLKRTFILCFVLSTVACASKNPGTPSITWIDDGATLDEIDTFIESDSSAVPAKALRSNILSHVSLVLPKQNVTLVNDLYTYAIESVVIISGSGYCKNCDKRHGTTIGTGFFISETGAIATNYHVIDGNGSGFYVTTVDGTTYPITNLLVANEEQDIAIVEIDSGGKSFTPLPIAAHVRTGESVWVIGHPDHRFFTFTDGIVSRFRKTIPKKGSDPITYEMMITAPFSPGSSGGPVLTKRGNVVGIVRSRETVGSPRHKGHTHEDIPAQVAHSCIPSSQLLELISSK